MTLQEDWLVVRDDAIGMETDPDIDLVDVYVVTVAVRLTASFDLFDKFIVDHARSGDGVFAELTIDDLAGGPSYINLGAWIGDQTDALIFIALGAHHQLWKVISPALMGFEKGSQAGAELAGGGFVMAGGLDPNTAALMKVRQRGAL